MTRYERVQKILDQSIGGPGVTIGYHGAFWRSRTRDQFVAYRYRGLDLVKLGDGAGSNLVKALKGEAPFGADLPVPPAGAEFSRMPAGYDPVSDTDIAFIQRWIDEGCLEDNVEADVPQLSWRPTNAPIASSRTDDVWFINPTLGWAVNSDGTIIQTRDGGESWVTQFQDFPPVGIRPTYFRCLGFASEKRGWAGTLTAGKTLFETRDGSTWSTVANLPPLVPSAICGMSVVSESVAFVSGTNYPNRPARMMKTSDGGDTWTAWEMGGWAHILVDTFFTSPDRGWVVGGKADHLPATRQNVKPVVLYTEDGGRTWVDRLAAIRDQLPLGEWGWKIQFLDQQVGFVSLENFNAGAILTTVDGGMTWERRPVNDPQGNANLEGVGFVDENHGWVGGWGDSEFERLSSSETFDGGRTWRDANEIGLGINRFRFFGSPVTVGYASGQTVYKYASVDGTAPLAVRARVPLRGKCFDSLEPLQSTEAVRVSITVPKDSERLGVWIWDRFGELVRTLVDETSPVPGDRVLDWDRTDASGTKLQPGYFIWRAMIDGAVESRLVRVT